MQMCDPVLRYRKSGFLYNGRIFRGKSFCLINNKKLTKITGGIISLRFYLKVKCNEQGEKEMKRKKVRRNKTRQTMSGMLKIIRRKEIWQEPFMKESQNS